MNFTIKHETCHRDVAIKNAPGGEWYLGLDYDGDGIDAYWELKHSSDGYSDFDRHS